jgi:predicted RNA-binding protein YlxR (DUF448 family)
MRSRRPIRTCVACRQEAGKAELVRIVRGPDGAVALDRTGRMPGRGAYLHVDPACLGLARKRRALDRALGVSVPSDLWAELPPGDGVQVSNSPGPA